MSQVLLALQSWGPPPVAPPSGKPSPFRPICPPAVPAFSESSCGLRWEISHYPALPRGARKGDTHTPPSLELERAGDAPALAAPTLGPTQATCGVCALWMGGGLGLGRESGRRAVSQPLLYFKM